MAALRQAGRLRVVKPTGGTPLAEACQVREHDETRPVGAADKLAKQLAALCIHGAASRCGGISQTSPLVNGPYFFASDVVPAHLFP
jgi:hypothetical protein